MKHKLIALRVAIVVAALFLAPLAVGIINLWCWIVIGTTLTPEGYYSVDHAFGSALLSIPGGLMLWAAVPAYIETRKEIVRRVRERFED